MRAVKVYNVALDDIDDNGEVKPDAELMPLFANFYKYKPGTRDEVMGQPAEYKGNVHKNKEYTLVDAKNKPFFKTKVNKRGFSAIGYNRGRNTIDNAPPLLEPMSDNAMRLPNVETIDDEDGGFARIYINENNKFSDTPLLRILSRAGKISNIGNVNSIALPFIVSGDEDDFVSLNDILEKGYDPWRDFTNEVQMKNIHVRQLPSGLLVPRTKSKLTKEIQDNIKPSLHMLADSFGYMKKELYKIRTILTDKASASSSGRLSGIINDDAVTQIISTIKSISQNDMPPLARSILSILPEDVIHDISPKYANNIIHSLDDIATGTFGNTVAIYDKQDVTVGDTRKLDDLIYTYGVYIRILDYGITNGHVKGDVSNSLTLKKDVDWVDFLNKEFSKNDTNNVSDKHMKHIIKDVTNDILSDRSMKNIIGALNGKWY